MCEIWYVNLLRTGRCKTQSSTNESNGNKTAGSLDYETNDAISFASWDVDYLKYDNCYHMGRFGTPKLSFDRYKVMADALNATGRPMLYSLCNWGEDYSHTACLQSIPTEHQPLIVF